MGPFSDYVRAIEKLYWLTNFGSCSLVILYISYTYNTVNKVICRSFFRELNSKLDGNYNTTDDKLCNCRFNLTVIFITIMFRSTQLVCCTHQIKLPNANLHSYTGLRHTCNHWKYDTYNMST